MRMPRVIAAAGLSALLFLAGAFAGEPASNLDPSARSHDAADGNTAPSARKRSVAELVDGALRASGLEDAAVRARYAERFERILDDLDRRVGRTRSVYRRARRLHAALHARVFHRYSVGADGIDAILDRGEYNCVSATLFWGIAGRALGVETQVVESPRHVFLRLDLDGRDVDIECTSPMGFDLRHDLDTFRTFAIAYKIATPEEMERRGPYAMFEEFHGIGEPVGLEAAEAFVWHNTAERALARGDALEAARAYVEEWRLNPELATRSDGFTTSLARAFRIEYEAGRFDSAWEVAKQEIGIFPAKTTTRDRLLAAAAKRVEAACDAGAPGAGEAILDTTDRLLEIAADRARLGVDAAPRIAAAAVRLEDWALAHRMVERFAGLERDEVESDRLRAWLEAREAGAASARDPVAARVCGDPGRAGTWLSFAEGPVTGP